MSNDRRKVRTGRVVSDKMNRTVVVQVERQIRHRLYKKLMCRRSKLVVHDPENVAMVGDLVEVIESRPISKTKRWGLVKVLQKSEVVDVRPDEVEVQTYESPEVTPISEPEVQVQTQKPPEETPVAESEVEVQTHESPEETPVPEPEVGVQTQEPPEETPVPEPEVDVDTHESPEETPIPEPEVHTQEPPEETPIPEPEVDVHIQEPPEETPVPEPEVDVQTHESPEETPVPEPEVQTEQMHQAPFASLFFDAQTSTPPDAPTSIEALPDPGPQTQQHAEQQAEQSRDHGRSGQHIQRTVTRWVPTEAADELANRFREMVHGDYGKRCQVCGRSFAMPNGELQVFVVHVVQPSSDDRTNYFGNLMGLCGWHYSLVRYGMWTLIDHETGEPGRDWEHMKEFMLNALEQEDAGGRYVVVRVRFWNIYEGGNPDAGEVDGEIRYSIPHWTYVRQLLSE